MHKSVLIKLAETSTRYVEEKNLRYYYEADGFKFNNKHLAAWYEKEYNVWAPLVCQQLDNYRSVLDDRTLDMAHDYNHDYLKLLRKKYDHVQLLLSGGYDSTTVFLEAVEKDIWIDEVISICTGSLSALQNEEIAYNVIPLALHHKDSFGKFNMLTTSYSMLAELYENRYCFFTQTTAKKMPQWFGFTFTALYHKQHPNNSCYIRSSDKPQLLHYRGRWYTVGIDHNIANELDIPNYLYFWMEPENIKSLIKDSRCYRNYLVDNYNIRNNETNFYKVYDEGNVNFHINRRELLYPEKQLKTTGIFDEKAQRVVSDVTQQDQCAMMNNYFRCLETFYTVFPEGRKDNLISYNQNGKFAWLIDIDSLELFTPEELIPNGLT